MTGVRAVVRARAGVFFLLGWRDEFLFGVLFEGGEIGFCGLRCFVYRACFLLWRRGWRLCCEWGTQQDGLFVAERLGEGLRCLCCEYCGVADAFEDCFDSVECCLGEVGGCGEEEGDCGEEAYDEGCFL